MSAEWRVHVLGTALSVFVYEVTAADEGDAIEKAYAKHGRRLRSGDISEPLGSQAQVFRLGADQEDDA